MIADLPKVQRRNYLENLSPNLCYLLLTQISLYLGHMESRNKISNQLLRAELDEGLKVIARMIPYPGHNRN